MKVELSIAVADKESSMAASDIRKREGDIVNVKQPGKPRGFMTLSNKLFIPVSFNTAKQFNEIRFALTHTYYEGGAFPDEELPENEPPMLAKFRYQIPFSQLGDIDLQKAQDKTCIYQPFLRESEIISWPHWNKQFLLLRYIGGVYQVRRTHRTQRKIHEEKIRGQTIRFIRPKEPATSIELTEEQSPWRTLYCSTQSIGNDEERVFEWSANNLIRDKYTNDWVEVSSIG